MIFMCLYVALCLSAQDCIRIHVPIPEKAAKPETILSDVEYISLETTSDCLMRSGASVYVTEEFVIVAHFFDKAFLFDRKTGRFIHEIGSKGQGPDEYTGWWAGAGFSPKGQILYALESTCWKGYDIKTGRLKQIIKMPSEHKAIHNPYLYKKEVYLGYTNNITGRIPYKLVAFDREGVVSKVYPNYNQVELQYGKNEYPMDCGIFYEYGSSVYFHVPKTDTVFQVTKDRLIPYACFDHPKETPIEALGETLQYIVFKALTNEHNYVVFYDKTKKRCYVDFVMKNDPEQYLYAKATKYGLNGKGELAALLKPEDVILYLEKHPENRQKLDKHLLDLQEDDNPVVMILKLK